MCGGCLAHTKQLTYATHSSIRSIYRNIWLRDRSIIVIRQSKSKKCLEFEWLVRFAGTFRTILSWQYRCKFSRVDKMTMIRCFILVHDLWRAFILCVHIGFSTNLTHYTLCWQNFSNHIQNRYEYIYCIWMRMIRSINGERLGFLPFYFQLVNLCHNNEMIHKLTQWKLVLVCQLVTNCF